VGEDGGEEGEFEGAEAVRFEVGEMVVVVVEGVEEGVEVMVEVLRVMEVFWKVGGLTELEGFGVGEHSPK
jgi:hypothetical protein